MEFRFEAGVAGAWGAGVHPGPDGVPLPAFPEAARAQAIFVEEVQLAVLGRKEVKAAIASVMERVKPLLPT